MQDASGDFRLEISGFVQYRYGSAFRDSTPADPGNFESGFQMRRLRLAFQGHVFDPSIQFKISHSLGRAGGESRLSDGYIKKTWDNGLTLRAGQFKLPFLFEEMTSAKRQLTTERSITNDVFTLKRSRGVELSYQRDRWRAWASYSNGGRSTDLDVTIDSTRWALTGRIEFLPVGDFRQFSQGGAAAGDELGAMIGAAIHIEENDADDQFGSNSFRWTLDGALRGHGWSLGAAIISRMDNSASAGRTAHDWGRSFRARC